MSKNTPQSNNLPKSPDITVMTSESYEPSSYAEVPAQSAVNCAVDVAGIHIIVDFWGAQSLQDIKRIEEALKDAAAVAGAILLHIHLHQFSSSGGVTGVALLAESHISVHTWPEREYAAFDVFMCGDAQPQKAVQYLKQVFNPAKIKIREISRG